MWIKKSPLVVRHIREPDQLAVYVDARLIGVENGLGFQHPLGYRVKLLESLKRFLVEIEDRSRPDCNATLI